MADLTHIDARGQARMVDVGAKPATARRATATGRIRMSDAARAALLTGDAPKGDVLAAARIAGIMAAKRTADLIPLCHPLPLTRASVELTPTDDGVAATAEVATTHQTGVEMEALTAVAVALLTVHDMLKAIDKGMVIDGVRVVAKAGGKSGDWVAG